MNKKLVNIFWGLVLIVSGGLALAQTQGYLSETVSPTVWMIVFAVISLGSLASYFISGIHNWGMLFPAGVFAALTFLVWTSARGSDTPAMAASLFVALGLPFILAFGLNRGKNWWALIPAGVMAFLTFTLLVVEQVRGEVIGSALLFSLAVAFGAVFVTVRRWWAALVAYIFLVLGFMPLMATGPRPELAGIVIMFAIALPFFLVYFRNPDVRFWAIIPAGVLGTAGLLVAFILLTGLPGHGYDNRLANSLMYTGTAASFAVVWLRHQKRWSMVLALLAAIAAAANLLIGGLETAWPLLIVLAGCYMVYAALRRPAVG